MFELVRKQSMSADASYVVDAMSCVYAVFVFAVELGPIWTPCEDDGAGPRSIDPFSSNAQLVMRMSPAKVQRLPT